MIGGFRSAFFVAKKPLPMTRNCTFVNFYNLHSLLGQFGSLVFEQMESSDWCWLLLKKSLFRETKEKLKISCGRKAPLSFCIKL